MIAVRDGDSQRVRYECEPKLVRIAAIGDRLAQQPAILYDIHKIAKPECEAGDRDVDPIGIGLQRRPDFIKRRAQRIRFLSVVTARFEPSRYPCAGSGKPRRRFFVRVERDLTVLDRSEQWKQRQHVLSETLQAPAMFAEVAVS